jgi:sugar-specific transcriptional regulator TrmB
MTPSATDPVAAGGDFQELRFLLTKLGLEEREVEVYLALIALGIAPASHIAKQANLQRSNTYLVLRSLEEKGLVTMVERGKIQHFIPEPPEKLIAFTVQKERQLQHTKQLLEGALPYLRSISAPLANKPRVSISMGYDGVRQAYRDLLQKEYVATLNAERIQEVFGTTVVDYFFGDSSKKVAGRELIVENDAGKRYVREGANKQVHKKLLPAAIQHSGDMCVVGDALILFAYDEDKTVVRIDHPAMAGVFRSWFDWVWAQGQ